MTELTQSRLKELLHYNPETGMFTRLVSRTKYKAGSIAGSLNKQGYIHIKINKRIYKAHRLVFLYMTGKFPEDGLQTDHINHVKDDNSWVNLRLVTCQENQRNCNRRKDNPSGCTGVIWDKRYEKWLSRITIDGKKKHLGYFDELEDAIAARKQANIKYNFHQNHGK